MVRLILTSLFLSLMLGLSSQKKFTKIYNRIREYDNISETGLEPRNVRTIFIFNANTNKDIKILWSNSNTTLLINTGVYERKLYNGIYGQTIVTVDENNHIIGIVLFDDNSLMMNTLYNNGLFQFYNK